MPRFAQLADMEARFDALDLEQLTDGDGAYDAAKVTVALDQADAIVNGYVASRHGDTTALEGNALLTNIACDIAFHRLWKSTPPEHVEASRKEAIRQLTDISAGRIKLDDGAEQVPPRKDQVQFSGPGKVFGRDGGMGYY